MKLQPHQQATVDYFARSKERGLFVLHSTGSGKSLTAVAVSEHLRYFKQVIVLAPKSLHDNMRKEIGRYGADTNRYRFVSSNASNMIDKLEITKDELTGIDIKSLKLNDKLIIIDEAHNLLVGMGNGSKGGSALYDMLMSAKNCKVLLLTASGIINNIYESAIALNLCKGPIFTEDGERTTLLPESEEEFNRYFVDEKNGKLKNANKLRNRIRGLVSYKGEQFERKVVQFYEMLGSTIKQENYPDRLPIKLELIPMSSIQYAAYEQARERERLEVRNAIVGRGPTDKIVLGGELQKSSSFGKSTSYRIKSRQLSDIYYPDDPAIDVYENMQTYSPKIKSIGDKTKPGVKTIIYSNFVEAGIKPMSEYLNRLGYNKYNPEKASDAGIHGFYGVYAGTESPEERTETLTEFNKSDSKLTILLISSSGAEGISCKGVRQIHILEPYWNYERIIQVMARGIRYRSHEHLPESERNVRVHLYFAIPPKDVKAKEKTTDVYLFSQSANKYQINQEMIKLMASVSIECNQFNSNLNFDCYKCEPRNGALMFLNDIHADMRYPLPCKNDTKPIEAKEVDLNGDLYYLSGDRAFVRTPADEYDEIVDQDIKDWIFSQV